MLIATCKLKQKAKDKKEDSMKTLCSKFVNLTLLIAAVSVSGCIATAAGVGAEAGYVASQEDRTTGQTIDDQVIVASVKSKLLADRLVSGLEINVDSFKGAVVLKGFVSSRAEAEQAIALAYSVSGVKSVTSKMVLDE